MGVHITKFVRSFDDFVTIGILVVIVLGFTHALVSLQRAPTADSLLLGFQLLILGEWSDELTERAETSPAMATFMMLAGVIVSVVGFLNLFIALISESYAEAQQKADSLWLKEKAAVCSQWMIRPFRAPPRLQERVLKVLRERCLKPVPQEGRKSEKPAFSGPTIWAMISTVLGASVSGTLLVLSLALGDDGPRHAVWLGLLMSIFLADAGMINVGVNGKLDGYLWFCEAAAQTSNDISEQPATPSPYQDISGNLAFQVGQPAWMWGLTLDDLREILHKPRYSPEMTMRDVVQNFVKPETADLGMGMAMKCNISSPRRAKVVISHCWDEVFAELITALEWCGHPGPFWICSFSLYQHFEAPFEFDKQYGKDPFSGAFSAVIQQAERVMMVIPRDPNASPIGRLFCRAEFACALSHGKPVDLISAPSVDSKMSISDPLTNLDGLRMHVSKSEAAHQCGSRNGIKSRREENRMRLQGMLKAFPGLNADIQQAWLQSLRKHTMPSSKFISLQGLEKGAFEEFLCEREACAEKLQNQL